MRAALRLSMDAATALMHACLPGMLARGRGGVLNVASLAGMLPMPYLALYGATKSYLVAASRAVASELAGTGVTVSVLLPGPVDTGFFAHNMQSDEERTGLLPGLSPEAVARTAIDGFLARQTVITPGLLAWLTLLGLKVLPKRMLVAFVRAVLRGALDGEAGASPAPVSAGGAAASPRPRRLRRVLRAPGHILVLACIAATLALQVGLATRKAPHVDSGPRSTIAAAAGLLEHGVYADVFVADGTERPAPGRYRAPGYPASLYGKRSRQILSLPVRRGELGHPKNAKRFCGAPTASPFSARAGANSRATQCVDPKRSLHVGAGFKPAATGP